LGFRKAKRELPLPIQPKGNLRIIPGLILKHLGEIIPFGFPNLGFLI